MRRAFTLIELLVVIAIIAILAAILFPVFSQAKEAAKKTAALSQMKQLATSVMIYASDADDYFVPASARGFSASATPVIWPEMVAPYLKNVDILVAPGSNGLPALNWATRGRQTIGYSDATGVDPLSTSIEGNAAPGTEGFTAAVNFSRAEESARVGLFATTPGTTASGKERGYVFNPYNGPCGDGTIVYPCAPGTYQNGLPLIADVNLCTTPNYLGQNFSGNSAGRLKPIFARYGATGRNEGTSPVIFADGHAKSYSARAMNVPGAIIWRFR